MFLPIILEPFHQGMDNYYWIYLKYLFEAHKNGWTVITHKRFVEYRYTEHDRIEHKEMFYHKHEYELLTDEEMELQEILTIPEELFDCLKDEKRSMLDMMIYLINERYEPLEELLENYIVGLLEKGRIEGILNWQVHFASVKYLANKYNIPLIVNEYGPLRFPIYRNTGCMCSKDIHFSDEVEVRYNSFLTELDKRKIPILSRKEVMLLFLNGNKNKANMMDRRPIHEIGIIGTSPTSAVLFAKSKYDDLQLICDIRKEYSDKAIWFRRHPGIGDPYQAMYYYIKNYDQSVDSMNFIADSKRIASVHSSCLFEAMLMNRPVYSDCELSQYSIMCEHDYSKKYITSAPLKFVNFIVFAYLVPYELMLDEEYLRWRMTKPSEISIYMRNLEYYCEKVALPIKAFDVEMSRTRELIIEKMLSDK